MANAAMQEKTERDNADQHKNIYDMMSDVAKAESQASENVAMGAMRIISLQADETEAQLQNKELSDADRNKFFEERASIRRDAVHLADEFHANSVFKALGIAFILTVCFGAGYGVRRYMLRAA